MMKEWMGDTGQIVWAGFALVLFLGLFVGMLLWVFRPGSRGQYQERAQMPLDDQTKNGSAARSR